MANNDQTIDDVQDEEKKPCTTISRSDHSARSSTLLPSPIASAVSLLTRSSSLYLQLGSFIGSVALDGARATTLTGLELSRAVLEGILSRAGRDVASRSTGEMGRAEAEGLLERSIETLHSTITAVSFAASTGFHFSATALGGATDISQQLLASLDSILGSTDSSRAISSIVTLIRREFQNPATGQEGEKVGVTDLLIGICGLALLQRWCSKIHETQAQERLIEETIWDVVVLDNGSRADITEHQDTVSSKATISNSKPPTGIFDVVDGDVSDNDDTSDDDLPEIHLKQKIMQNLPPKAAVSITTEMKTTKIVTVEIVGAHPPRVALPSGVEIVQESVQHPSMLSGTEQGLGLVVPRYRVVYKVSKNKIQETNCHSRVASMNTPVPEIIELPYTDDVGVSDDTSEVDGNHDIYIPTTAKSDFHINEERAATTLTVSKHGEVAANQKRSRQPTSTASSTPTDVEKPPAKRLSTSKVPVAAVGKKAPSAVKPTEKKGTFRNALKKGSGTALSGLWTKPTEGSVSRPTQRATWNAPTKSSSSKAHSPPTSRTSNNRPTREEGHSAAHIITSRGLGPTQAADSLRSPTSEYISNINERRGSTVSHAETVSTNSVDSGPGSAANFRTQLRAQNLLIRARSERNISSPMSSPAMNHRRTRSHVPSIYTVHTNPSTTSLGVFQHNRASAFDNATALEVFTRTGTIQGVFPQHHLVYNVTRFIRFASASYGSSFLRVMGIVGSQSSSGPNIDTQHHYEHHSFSSHTQLPPDTILLSSFVDPAGGADANGQTGTGVPMVHFVSLDHDSKAVVLTCRGTLGFEDVLTDLTCDYDTLHFRGNGYSVHKGIHASARRLLDGGGGRVMATIAAALEEFPDYGLVMCGHSLGGGVVALLAVMISEYSSDPSSPAFVTSSHTSSRLLLGSSSPVAEKIPQTPRIQLPSGRPIHVYAYGPPATMSPALRLATRGLITTIVNGQDIVPYLSLGVLHDLQAVALAFKNDDSGAKGEVRARVWAGLKSGFADRWYNRTGQDMATMMKEDDQWAYSGLKALRASMLSSKLVPPGEVFKVECAPVLKRDAVGLQGHGGGLGRPAMRSILKYVRDVEKKFGEVRFGGSMLLDHSPGRYEISLGALAKGVLI